MNIQSIKTLQIKTLIVCSLSFPSNTILSCTFLFFLITGLYVLIHAVIAQIFNATEKLVIPTVIPTNEANADIEAQTLTIETKTRKCSK